MPTAHGDGGVAVDEVRINTFRPQSRGSSLSRPMSVMSHSTSETGPSDMERQDSALNDSGFQLYQTRKNKRHVGELNVHEDKSEQKQTTVKATFDKREIYEVFGNALPGPEFIEENVGFKNGQLQFLQHPNGDVSAHQWSSDRYMWENIGQFSNIRKKIEGQLAADRLKGETAYQTVQRDTMVYFRTVAKQREANVMGLPFGAKEIQAVMPDPKIESTTVPMAAKDLVLYSKPDEASPANSTAPQAQQTFDTQRQIFANAGKPTAQALFPQYAPTAPRPDTVNFTPNIPLRPPRQEDPFYSSVPYPHAHGHYQYPYHYYGHIPQAPQPRAYVPRPAHQQDLNHDFQFPPLSSHPQKQDLPQWQINKPASIDRVTSQIDAGGVWQQTYDAQPGGITSYRAEQPLATIDHNTVNTAPLRSPQPTPQIRAPQPQHVNARSVARDQLWKLTETAKERSQSQANIRTVLHDPFQSQDTPSKSKQEDETLNSDTASSFTHNVAGNKLQPPTSFDTSSSRFFPTGLAPQIQKPPSPSGSATSNNLENSSPENLRTKQTYAHATPTITKTSESKGTPQTLQPPFFPEELSVHPSTSTSSSASKKQTYDELLQEWWTSGNKFARQEEFYRSLQRTQGDTPSKLTGPPAHLTPIGPPSRTPKKESTSNSSTSFDITRLLIPVLENLSSYVQGPVSKRRDYWSQWSQPPEWAVDPSPEGNNSFYDKDWGTPPARVGRDPRYSGSRSWQQTPQRGRLSVSSGGYGSPALSVGTGAGVALDRRFAFGGRY
jgi:hypothetical protein